MARRKIKTAIKRRLEFMSMARTSKKNRKKRAKAKSKTNKALAKLEAERLLRVSRRMK